jgi:hypothetical protein
MLTLRHGGLGDVLELDLSEIGYGEIDPPLDLTIGANAFDTRRSSPSARSG